MPRAKPIFLVPIPQIVVVIDPVQFIGWVVPSCVCTDIVFNGIFNKLQFSMLYVKKAMNRVYICVITSI